MPSYYCRRATYADSVQARALHMEETWRKVEPLVRSNTVTKREKTALLNRYVIDFPEENPHDARAKWFLKLLADNRQVDAKTLDIEEYRTKTEWFSFRALGGTCGAGTLGASTSLGDDTRWHAGGGTVVGFPWHLDGYGRHELRIGMGLSIVYFSDGKDVKEWCTTTSGPPAGELFDCTTPPSGASNITGVKAEGRQSNGVFFTRAPTVSYAWHAYNYFALETGISLNIPVIELYHNGHSATYSNDSYVVNEAPAMSFVVFFGFRLYASGAFMPAEPPPPAGTGGLS